MYSADGKSLAIPVWREVDGGEQRAFVDIWDVETKQRVKTLSRREQSGIHGFAYSPDGQYIATYTQRDSFVEIWDVANGNRVKRLRGPVIDDEVVDAAFSPDGRYLAVASGKYIKLYDAREIGR